MIVTFKLTLGKTRYDSAGCDASFELDIDDIQKETLEELVSASTRSALRRYEKKQARVTQVADADKPNEEEPL